MTIIDMIKKPAKVFINDVLPGEPFLSETGCLYLGCSLHSVAGITHRAGCHYGFHVKTGQVVCFANHEEVTRVEAEAVIRATL